MTSPGFGADSADSAAAGPCPCQSGDSYAQCCSRFHSGETQAPTAERLMRSRYSAFVNRDASYLLATWHPSTRPAVLELDDDPGWNGLRILSHTDGGPFDAEGTVEFEAFHAGGRQRELSRFVREAGRWYYVTAV